MLNNQAAERMVRFNGDELDVHSIFPTIQGEGPFAGRPAIFIRLAGCNLKCPMCDTDYTSGRETLTLEQITETVAAYRATGTATTHMKQLIVITGGEPFRQPIEQLCQLLTEDGYIIQIETNGTAYQSFSDELRWQRPVVVCSPKTGKIHPKLVPYIDYLKYVVEDGFVDPVDGLPLRALRQHEEHVTAKPPKGFSGTIYVQPIDIGNEKENKRHLKAAIRSCMEFGYTLCLQVHKIIEME